jgi:hypothetical protein
MKSKSLLLTAMLFVISSFSVAAADSTSWTYQNGTLSTGANVGIGTNVVDNHFLAPGVLQVGNFVPFFSPVFNRTRGAFLGVVYCQNDPANGPNCGYTANVADNTYYPFYGANRAKGTPSALLPNTKDTILGEWGGQGYSGVNGQGCNQDGWGCYNAALMRAVADGDWGVNNWPGRLEFWTQPPGVALDSSTAVKRLVIDSQGNSFFYGPISVEKDWPSPSSTNLISQYTSFGDFSRFVLRQAGGSSAAPSASASGQSIGAISYRGYDITNGFSSSSDASIVATTDEAFTSSNHGTRLTFYGTYTGTKTVGQWLQLANGNVVLGDNGQISTSATNGFFYIPSSGGPPTGTPTTFTGKVPCEYDTSTNKMCCYNSGWKCSQMN